jgi:antitoxin (DNA-binding transcriptional repressor) of toxin-antitoxin stability system
MKAITEFEAQEDFDSLLDGVEQGESFLIVRGERAAAWMTAAKPSPAAKVSPDVDERIGLS